tara:strand:+ start:1184 stop:1486 length:303 start_codon:yes stop_codon:yes gene_type:complete
MSLVIEIENCFLADEVKSNIKEFLTQNWKSFQSDAVEYDGLDITFATNEKGDAWNYQTGDNSFTGGAYGLPHWAVTTIYKDDEVETILETIIDQLEECLS